MPQPLELAPAKWIWFPSRRTLSNTFVLFRREIELAEVPATAMGWIAADSRYRLTVNGERVQWGPAPHDPRHAEADPVELAPYLRPGKNVIGVEVLFYGYGEGTWPFGKPGLLLNVQIGGQRVVSDSEWRVEVDRAHRPGQFRRSFLRALQEEFDARRRPQGWDRAGFDDSKWLSAMELSTPPTRAAFAGGYSDYQNEVWMLDASQSTLTERSIPLLNEDWWPATLRHEDRVVWHREPEDWFEFRTPGSFEIRAEEARSPIAHPAAPVPVASRGEGVSPVTLGPAATGEGVALTYELVQEVVGWPAFTIDAPEGTVVELMVQESHDHATTPWLDTHFHAWSRFVCREGINRFETFDYEAGRWLQLHVRGNSRPVTISDVGIRRRVYAWPNEAHVQVDEPALQRLFDASVNTINNSAQDIIVDGMGRERQQYSGDGSHQLHTVRYAFGDTLLSARYLRTYAKGQLLDGVFSDSWPAVDRLMRLWERNMDASGWGPLVDHSVGFVFDHYHHWMQSGDLDPIRENFPKLEKFASYLESIRDADGLLPVEELGVNTVWIDHDAFKRQRDKQCSFNLYAAAMFEHALAPLADATGRSGAHYRELGRGLVRATQRRFYSEAHGTYVSNLPWQQEDGEIRMDDRSISTALLYDQLPAAHDASIDILSKRPAHLGVSYPCNLPWNYWALSKTGHIQVVLDELRQRWAPMQSVILNNTLQEHWQVTPDTTSLMSHCPLAPLIAMYQGVMGLWPTKPGFAEMEVRPQLGDLGRIDLTAHTPVGAVRMKAERDGAGHRVQLTLPIRATVVLPNGTEILEPGTHERIVVN